MAVRGAVGGSLGGLLLMATLGGCAVIHNGPSPSLPDQISTADDNPTAITIVLPSEIYKTLPANTTGAQTATEAQLAWVEDYALRLPVYDRHALDALVDDCRFSARAACLLQPSGS